VLSTLIKKFVIFARFNYCTIMKKIIVIAALFLGTIAIFAACDTQHKCAAYGHYACYEAPADVAE